MRASQVISTGLVFLGISAVAIPLGCIVLGVLLYFGNPYIRFIHKDATYYRHFAAACDSLQQSHPIGTNDFVYRHGIRSLMNSVEISGKDPSLPKIIRALGPEHVTLSSNRVHISVGEGRGGFGILWEQDIGQKGWSLRTYAESLERTHYQSAGF